MRWHRLCCVVTIPASLALPRARERTLPGGGSVAIRGIILGPHSHHTGTTQASHKHQTSISVSFKGDYQHPAQ